jgi:hypothetical protein
MTKARKAALSMLLECAMMEVSSYDFDDEENFTAEDCDAVYELLVKRYNLHE